MRQAVNDRVHSIIWIYLIEFNGVDVNVTFLGKPQEKTMMVETNAG